MVVAEINLLAAAAVVEQVLLDKIENQEWLV
jgi:hypothetical protein